MFCCTDKMVWTVAGKVFSEKKVRDKRCRISKGHYVCMLTTLAFLFFFSPCLSVSWIFINHLWYFFSSHGSLFHLVICAPLGFFFFTLSSFAFLLQKRRSNGNIFQRSLPCSRMHSDIVEQELFRDDDEIKTKIRRRSPTLAALKRNRNSEGAANCFFQGTKIEDCSLCAVVVLFFS